MVVERRLCFGQRRRMSLGHGDETKGKAFVLFVWESPPLLWALIGPPARRQATVIYSSTMYNTVTILSCFEYYYVYGYSKRL